MDIHQAERATHMEDCAGTVAQPPCWHIAAVTGQPLKVVDPAIGHHGKGLRAASTTFGLAAERVLKRRTGSGTLAGSESGTGRAAVAAQVRGAACGPREWAAN